MSCEVGRGQALSNGGKLKNLISGLPRFISSPLGRCRETANIVANEVGFDLKKIEYDDRVKELSFGSWEGQQLADIQSRDEERNNT